MSIKNKPLKTFHPFAIFILGCQFIVILFSSRGQSLMAVSALAFVVAVLLINRENIHLVLWLGRLALIACFLLFLIYGVEIHPIGIRESWLEQSMRPALRLIGVFSGMFCMLNTLHRREIYSFLIACRVPLEIILVIFRAFWFVPQIRSRANEILLALRLRGIQTRNWLQRFRALVLSFSSLFNSMALELEESSLSLATKGISLQGSKRSLYEARWTLKDFVIVIFFSGLMQLGCWGL